MVHRLRLLIASLGLALLSPMLLAAPVTDVADYFDRHFEQQLAEHQIPGGVYAIVEGDQIVRIRGVGVRARGSSDPVDPFTLFRIASVSKTFAAGLAAVLAEQGYFNWDDPVIHYVPDFSFRSARYSKALQVEHLLAQTTGVMPNAYDNMIEANVLPERILPHFRQLDPMCTPGQCYGYQNVLFSLIEPIVQQTTQKDYATLMQELIFEPLQMPTASVGMEPFMATENKAMPHVRARGGWYQSTVLPTYYRFAPAAGINASAMDLSHWVMAQLGHYPDVMPEHVLATITDKRVRTVRDLRRGHWRQFIRDAHYALGWRVYQFGDEELVYHGGWVRGFRADVAYSRDRQVGLVILLNAESNIVSELSTFFWSRVFDAIQLAEAEQLSELLNSED
ncbi:MAG: beta-lactamase family protein [Alkalimonas sp.]|nr:beta-lactamase family protein [Alkalimonas sp.]